MKPPPLAAPALAALFLLLAFPQLSETIYAPVLPQIATAFHVTAGQAQTTMSIYFAAFAAGVLFWGRLADLYGRKTALLGGLLCYGVAAGMALLAQDFTLLLLSRALLAFGASVGSIIGQTMLRDRYQGTQLAAIYSSVAAVLALSPALGPPLGMLLATRYGYTGVFAGLCVLAALLLLCGAVLPETGPEQRAAPTPLGQLARRMLRDPQLWTAAWLVAGFNLILFGYYTLAPFTLAQLGMPDWLFGASGLLIAAAACTGAWLNRRGLQRYSTGRMVNMAAQASVLAAVLQALGLRWEDSHPLAATVGLLLTQVLMIVAVGCGLPNVLASALQRYRAVQGTAGALFGLSYYVMIAAGLGMLGMLYREQPMAQPVFMLAASGTVWLSARRLR